MTGFLILAFLILIAMIVAVPIATRFGLGSVLGYLLAGMAISPLLAALRVDVEALQVFAEFGVVMMLFIIGLEMEPSKLWDMRGKLLGLGGGQVVLTTLLIMGIAVMDQQPWQTALAIGMILSLSSTAIIVQSLSEKKLMRTEGGEASFSVLLVQDVAVIPILAILPLLALPALYASGGGHAADAGHGGIDLTSTMPIWLAGVCRVAAIAAVVAIGVFAIRPLFRFIARANLRELFTAAALVVVIGIALLMSLVGLSPALGAFIAGVVLATSEYRHELESDIDPIKGILLGVFFITVGASIDFTLASEIWREVLFWAAVTIVAKMAVLFAVGWLYGLRKQPLWLFCLSLPQAGEFAFVLISFAIANAVLGSETGDMLLLIVALTMLMTPLLFIAYDKVIAPAYSRDMGREANKIDEDNQIIIAGRGRVGGIVDRMLQTAGYTATVIDYDSSHLEVLQKFGIRTYFGDATRPDLLHAAGIERAKLLIVALDERDQIDKLVKYVVQNFPHVHVIARAKDRNHVYELWSYGCRDIVRETYDASIRIGRSAFEALGVDRQNAVAMASAFEDMDRSSMLEVAELYDPDIPSIDNEPLIAKVKELRQKWDPILRDQMDEILGRGR